MNNRSHKNEERNKAKLPIQNIAEGIVQGFSITPRGNLERKSSAREEGQGKRVDAAFGIGTIRSFSRLSW